MELTSNQFEESAVIAIQDITLQTALDRGTGNADGRRRKVIGELPHAQALRQQGRGSRLRALHDLPDLLEKLEANITAAGGHVLWASDAAEANGHIIMPVMHRTKEMIRDLFVRELNMPTTDEASEMTAFIRQRLRGEYLTADFGMSGGNFMIAETGTVVIVTNEGNGRLSTSVPRVHIAVVGIEKVIPTWEDFGTLIQMLPRSATGQRISVYVNGFTGPARPGEPDGPEEFYLILLDNGRSDIYASEYTEALACIRCGACLNACPVYQNVGGHSYGWVYPGPIGAIITPLLKGIENAAPLPFASSLCGACKQACPVDINIPDMLLKLRRDLQDVQEPVWKLSMKAYGFGFSHPLLYEMGGKAASAASRAMGGSSEEGIPSDLPLPYPLNGWTQSRDFPPFAAQSFHDWWREHKGK